MKVSGESTSSDVKAAEEFLGTLDKLIVEENYLLEQIFNMDETSLFWKPMLKGLSSITRPSQCQVSRFV